MIINSVRLKNFRCFDDASFSFNDRCIIIQGDNGSGKSSLLEALHYSCYLRSFRTHLNRELVKLEGNHFFIEIQASNKTNDTEEILKAGFSQSQGKQILLNEKQITSYKELIDQHRIVTLCAQDSELVSGAPEYRRDFLNYSLFLIDPSVITLFKEHKQILAHRNALIVRGHKGGHDHYLVKEMALWSQKLWEASQKIQHLRKEYLAILERRIVGLLEDYFYQECLKPESGFSIEYHFKGIKENQSFDEFWRDWSQRRLEQEYRYGRTLFGAHLDDFAIMFEGKKARIFASRGQQKLLTFLLKIAQIQETNSAGEAGVLLLDDFVTDFDAQRISNCLKLINSLNFQVFLTCPLNTPVLNEVKAQRIEL